MQSLNIRFVVVYALNLQCCAFLVKPCIMFASILQLPLFCHIYYFVVTLLLTKFSFENNCLSKFSMAMVLCRIGYCFKWRVLNVFFLLVNLKKDSGLLGLPSVCLQLFQVQSYTLHCVVWWVSHSSTSKLWSGFTTLPLPHCLVADLKKSVKTVQMPFAFFF